MHLHPSTIHLSIHNRGSTPQFKLDTEVEVMAISKHTYTLGGKHCSNLRRSYEVHLSNLCWTESSLKRREHSKSGSKDKSFWVPCCHHDALSLAVGGNATTVIIRPWIALHEDLVTTALNRNFWRLWQLLKSNLSQEPKTFSLKTAYCHFDRIIELHVSGGHLQGEWAWVQRRIAHIRVNCIQLHFQHNRATKFVYMIKYVLGSSCTQPTHYLSRALASTIENDLWRYQHNIMDKRKFKHLIKSVLLMLIRICPEVPSNINQYGSARK